MWCRSEKIDGEESLRPRFTKTWQSRPLLLPVRQRRCSVGFCPSINCFVIPLPATQRRRPRPVGRCSVIRPLLPSNEAPCAGGENAPRSATLGPFPYPTAGRAAGFLGSPPSRVGGRCAGSWTGGSSPVRRSLSSKVVRDACQARPSGCRSGVIAGDRCAVRASESRRSPSRGRSTSPIPARLSRPFRRAVRARRCTSEKEEIWSPRCVAGRDGSGSLW